MPLRAYRKRKSIIGTGALAFFLGASITTSAAAQSDDRIVWNEDWPRFQVWEYAVTGTLLVGGLALDKLTRQPDEARWTGPILIDVPARRVLVAETRDGREIADALSDFGWLLGQWYTTVVDAGAVTLIADTNTDVALQMTLMNVEAMAIGFILTRGSHRLFARQRPVMEGCKGDPDYDVLCPFSGVNASFFSGHASMAFVGAGLACVHHQFLPLYGGGPGDIAACAGVTAVAATTGLLRAIADRHYLSDVVVAAIVGFGVGYGVPYLFHYRHGARTEEYGGSMDTTTMPLRGPPPPPVVNWAGAF